MRTKLRTAERFSSSHDSIYRGLFSAEADRADLVKKAPKNDGAFDERAFQACRLMAGEQPNADAGSKSILTVEFSGWRPAAVGRLRQFPVFSESRQWIDGAAAKVSYAEPIPEDSPRPGRDIRAAPGSTVWMLYRPASAYECSRPRAEKNGPHAVSRAPPSRPYAAAFQSDAGKASGC